MNTIYTLILISHLFSFIAGICFHKIYKELKENERLNK